MKQAEFRSKAERTKLYGKFNPDDHVSNFGTDLHAKNNKEALEMLKVLTDKNKNLRIVNYSPGLSDQNVLCILRTNDLQLADYVYDQIADDHDAEFTITIRVLRK